MDEEGGKETKGYQGWRGIQMRLDLYRIQRTNKIMVGITVDYCDYRCPQPMQILLSSMWQLVIFNSAVLVLWLFSSLWSSIVLQIAIYLGFGSSQSLIWYFLSTISYLGIGMVAQGQLRESVFGELERGVEVIRQQCPLVSQASQPHQQ